jgi:hypothetical protein
MRDTDLMYNNLDHIVSNKSWLFCISFTH